MKNNREQLENMSQSQLEDKIASGYNSGGSNQLARFILQEKKDAKQHLLSLELIEKQGRWIKISTAITAATMLIAAVLGFLLSEYKQSTIQHSPQLQHKKTTQQQTKP